MDSEELRKNHIHLTPSAKHHMTIHWHNFVQSGDKPSLKAACANGQPWLAALG